HGGFLVGFVLIGIYLVGAVLDRLSGWRTQDSVVSNDGGSQWEGEGPALPTGLRGESSGYASWRPVFGLTTAGLLSLVAVGANPVGYRVLPHVLGYFRERLLVDVTVEYMSPNFHDLAPQFFLLLVLLSLAALALLPQRADVVDLGMLVVWISFSLYSVRNVPIFVVTCLPIVARLSSDALRQLLRKTERPGVSERFAATDRLFGRPLLPALLVAAALLLSGFGPPAARPMAAFDPKVFPVEALRKAEHVGVKGNLFNYFSWGGYVLYASYPKYRVFIDGQTDFYGEELTRDWLEVDRLKPDWEEVLDRYRIGWVLYPHESPLSVLLVRSPGWRLAYEDATADIFVRAAGGER
ncbi:MAG: hypothetical protein M1582_01025, partial [Actinobacteria bacterium]|nr:hypothetical protein [Actinomycetota bacterium]